jgi:serine/threonine protein kinase
MNEREVFIAALEKGDRAQRAAYLDDACGSDAALRRRIEMLLREEQGLGNFLESSPVGEPATLSLVRPTEGPGTVIGPYKLLEQIGEGGMGLVFMADQTQPVKRRVALKVLKPGMDTRQVVARFEAERQALALMDHPHIAKVFDGGATATGRPYFVMELVRGIPITDFCDQRRYTTRQRLELFVLVCQAVQHAHQRGIIHRDLKPSNVLVTLHDTLAVPKVIDFGIAKATSQPLTERTLFTHFAQLVGTPLYMSPEQAEMNGLDVDTRSDVYSLGVLLYELLTDTTPFTGEALRRAGLDEMRRLIQEQEPPTPSQRLNTLDAQASTTVAERRGVDARRLRQLLRGELDWIVMRALEKDRNRRYESASALAADVQRYLNDEAVAACPPSAGYRLRKYARRHRRALATAGIVAVALVSATAVSTRQAVVARDAQRQAEADRDRAQQAERRAATEAAIARAVNEFLQGDLLGQVSSAPPVHRELDGNRYLTVKEALDRAAARIGERFQDQPLVEAAIQTAIGEGYRSLYEFQLAVPHLERAVALRNAYLGSEHPDTISSRAGLSEAYLWLGRYREAISLRQQLLESGEVLLGPDHPETLARISSLAAAYQQAGEWDKSVQLREQLLEKFRAIGGPSDPETIGAMHDLAINYTQMGRLAESMALHEQVLEEYLKSATDPERQIRCMMTYAQPCMRAGKLDQAERLLREALRICRKQASSFLVRMGTANTCGWLAQTLVLKKQYDAAEPLAREAVAIWENEQPHNMRYFYWLSLLGDVLCGQHRYAEAEPSLVQGYEGMKQQEAILPANEKPRLAEAGERVVRFYEATNQPEKARVWREKLSAKLPDSATGLK